MNILLTGTTGGIGTVIAQELLSCGHNIFATGRKKDILEKYENYFVCDLTQKDDIEKLGQYIEYNKIDVLINNAGAYIYKSLEKLNYTDIEQIITTNLTASAYLIKAAIPNMKNNKWGRIINIGSISGVMGEPYASIYSASKAGLIGLTKALALELAQDNITVNTINPGWVETQLGLESIESGEFTKEEIVDWIPQKRFVHPSEIAGMIKYIISEEAKGVTGQSINLCAGLSVGY